MSEIDINQFTEDTAERRFSKKKTAPKISTDETETALRSSEKKKKVPKIPSIELAPSDDFQTEVNPDEEVSRKSKKKRAPKLEVSNENYEAISAEKSSKKKKSKAPKPSSIDDDFQVIETPTVEELEPYVEPKPKSKKSKKPKPAISGSFEELQVTNLDEIYSTNSETNTNGTFPYMPYDILASTENNTGEYEQAILDSFSNLASKVNFAQYVGEDQWCIIHLPKTARPDQRSLFKKMLPGGGSRDDKSSLAGRPPAPKGSLFNRLRTSVGSLVRDQNNLIFGDRPNYEVAQYEDEDDGVDTDDLHRYAQKLRELEDQDREVNPEFLVLRDGKTVYGVHESDADGKIKLATRKPIYDRFADQTPDGEADKKKLFSRIKTAFTRNKDKDVIDIKSAGTTPDPGMSRKSKRKSLSNDLTTVANDDPLVV